MRGVRLEGKKESSLIAWTIRRPPAPAKVHISLHQAEVPDPVPCVEIGARVRLGETIARSKNSLSADLHASVSGHVTAIGDFPHPVKGSAVAIEITSDGRDEAMPGIGKERPGWQELDCEVLLEIFRVSGVTGLRPGTFGNVPTVPGLAKTLVLNGCESEPYVTSDHALMMSHPMEILKGAEILRKLTDAGRVVIAIEDNKLEVIELIKSKIYSLHSSHFEVKVLPSIYPQGAEEVLKQSLSPRPRWPGFSPRGDNSDGISLCNVATAFAVYEAVVLQKPFYERVITVGGECVVEPRNARLRIGTSFADGFQTCRGIFREARKILMGGPMQGIAQENLEVPILKGTSAILALPKEVARPLEVEPCIRCGLCVDACPVSISPAVITLAAERDLFDTAREWGATHCIECGNCGYICPANRPMLQLMRYAISSTVSGATAFCLNCDRNSSHLRPLAARER